MTSIVPHRCWRVRPCRVAAVTPQDGACEIQVCVLSSPLLYPLRTCETPHPIIKAGTCTLRLPLIISCRCRGPAQRCACCLHRTENLAYNHANSMEAGSQYCPYYRLGTCVARHPHQRHHECTLMVSGHESSEDMLRAICSMRSGLRSRYDPAPLRTPDRRSAPFAGTLKLLMAVQTASQGLAESG